MRQPFRKVRSRPRRPSARPAPVRPTVEALEDRCVPSANFTGTLAGVVYLNATGAGPTDPNAITASGVGVTLTGATFQNAPVSATATTDANGNYSFTNLIPGTYQVSAGAGLGLVAAPGGANGDTATDVVSPGQSVAQNLGFAGLPAQAASLRYLASNWTPADLALSGPAGSGVTAVNSRPDSSPVVAHAVADFPVAQSAAPTQIDLAGVFSDPDTTDSTVTFNTSAGPLNVTLFDTTAPQTVANFLDYVNSGAYDNIFFTRLMNNFVLQGGGAALQTDASGAATAITAVPTNPPVPSEFGASNAAGTLAMALPSKNGVAQPNAGTNEFYFSLTNNSGSLDQQKFTVFGQVADAASRSVLAQLASATTHDESATPTAKQVPVDLSTVPMVNYTDTGHFPTDATAGNFEQIKGVTIDQQAEALTYSVLSNTNTGLVSASVTGSHLTLNYTPGATGSATITVQAIDKFGATAEDTFTVRVVPFAISSATDPVNAANKTNASASGTTEAGTTVQVTATDGANTTPPVTATVDASGHWTATGINTSNLADGTITYTAVLTDASGGTATTTRTATKHTTFPSVTISSVTDPVTAANQTDAGASGTTTPGAKVSVKVTEGSASTSSMQATVDAAGNWTATGIDVSSLPDGTITYDVTATDAFDNANTISMNATKSTGA